MDKESLKQKLVDEGFPHVYEWHDEPGTEYPAHAHKGGVSMYILDGGLTFWFGQEEKVLKQGDRFDVPFDVLMLEKKYGSSKSGSGIRIGS